ncbi:transposase [Kitasatospora sp. NBC_00374]|uniref:transposase n=1 Tax=Kitasatospora sp. NBC_00374 TaxID=2975964 RepID=UPI0030E1E366
MDFDRRQVTCPNGQVSAGWHGPYPTSSPTAAPLIVARFTTSQCQPCPDRPRCTNSRARNVGFPPRELRDLQVRVRAEQQTPHWKARYAVRSGVEGTINEFAHGHGMRRCRYRGSLGGPAHTPPPASTCSRAGRRWWTSWRKCRAGPAAAVPPGCGRGRTGAGDPKRAERRRARAAQAVDGLGCPVSRWALLARLSAAPVLPGFL